VNRNLKGSERGEKQEEQGGTEMKNENKQGR